MTSLKRILTGETVSITGAAILIGSSSLVSRFLGVLRERILVGTFGVGDRLDAYFASFQAPNFVYNLLILGTLSVALIPVFAAVYERDKEEAWRVAGAVMTAVAIVLGALSLALVAFAPQFTHLVAPGFSGDKFALAVSLTRVTSLSPFLFAVSSVFGSVLNARRNYFASALAPLAYNLSIILAVVFGAGRFGIHAVAYGVVAGAALHALIQAAPALAMGFRFLPTLGLSLAPVREVWKLFFPRIWGIDISQISLLIGSVIGSTLASGSVALFNLATNIQTVPVGVLGIPYAIAAFPVLSTALARGDRKRFLDTFSRTARQIVFLLLPIAAMTVVLRAHAIRLIIGTQGLSWDETRLAAAALAFFAASMAFQGLTPLLSRAFYAQRNTIIPVTVSGVAVAVFVAMAYGILGYLGDGCAFLPEIRALLRLQGIDDLRMLALPIAFSAASAFQAATLAVILRLKYGPIGGRRVALSFAKSSVAAAVALVATRAGLYLGVAVSDDRTFVGVLIQAAVAAAVGFPAFMIAAVLLRSEEVMVFLASLRKKALKVARPLGFGDATDAS